MNRPTAYAAPQASRCLGSTRPGPQAPGTRLPSPRPGPAGPLGPQPARPALRPPRPRRRHRAARQRQVHADAARGARRTGRLPGRPRPLGPPHAPPAALRRLPALVRLAHYAGLRRVLRSGRPVVVHDCGTQAWVRRWLAREARRRGAALHLLLLDVPPEEALAGQLERGRGVSRYAFRRHRTACARLLEDVESGRVPGAAPRRCSSTGTPRTPCAGSASPADRSA